MATHKKPAPKKTVAKKIVHKKPVAKKPASKPAAKPANKTVHKKPSSKPAAKAPAHKPAAKKAAPHTAHKAVSKPVAKPAPAHKPAHHAPAHKNETHKPAHKSAETHAHKHPAKHEAPHSAKEVKNHAPEPKKSLAAKPISVPKAAPAVPPPASKESSKPVSAADLKRRILERKTLKPIAFTLDEVREIAQHNAEKTDAKQAPSEEKHSNGKPAPKTTRIEIAKPAQPNHVKAASIFDILGFNPSKTAAPVENDESKIPDKFRRYYKILIELRSHVVDGLNQHTEETLKRSSKDDAGDLSSYGQHMADAGTDTFDRDFALSLVSSEQDALTEIEAAIERIHKGTYGICEISGQPINKDRLLAVPFTRYSAEAQKEIEKNKHRSSQRGGIFAEGEEGGGKIMDEDSED